MEEVGGVLGEVGVRREDERGVCGLFFIFSYLVFVLFIISYDKNVSC